MILAVLWIIFLSLVEVALSEECPEGWESHGNKCYKHSDGRATWHNAKEICESEGGTLANVVDESINTHLQRYDNRDYWIGLRVTSDRSDWLWNDGSTFVDDEFQWDDDNNEPNGQHTCARIQFNDKLGDKECENQGLYFICQADNNPGSWSDVGGFWFFFSNETNSQYEASNYCIDEGGYLARKDVLSALDRRVQSRDYWIGLSRRYWLDGSLYLWNNFRPASSDSSSHCYFMYKDYWNGGNCSKDIFYICEKDKETIPLSSTSTSKTTTTTTTTPPRTTQTTSTTVEVTPPPTLTPNTTSSIPIAQNTSDVTVSSTMESRTLQISTTENPTEDDEKQFSGIDSVVLYILIGVCVSIAIMVVVIIVLVVFFRRRANRTPVKEKTQTDAGKVENQYTIQLPAASSQANAQDITNDITAQNATDAGPKQPTCTVSDDAPIYAVPNKKKIRG